MSLRSFFVPQRLATSGSKYSARIDVVETNGVKQLLVNSIVQTGTYTRSLFANGFRELARFHTGPMKRILVLGVGGGGVFRQLVSRYPNADIVGVDIDAEVVRLARKHFGLDVYPNVKVTVSDARIYVENPKVPMPLFDLVIIDLYIGNDVPAFVTARRFLGAVSRQLRPGGSVLFNYFSSSGQKEKAAALLALLESVFRLVRMTPNRRNILYLCTN